MSRSECRYPLKRAFETKQKAIEDAKAIKRMVEQRGDTYSQLYPYRCPDGGHWHLTSQAPPELEVSVDDTDPAVHAARQTIKRWTTDGWNASRDFIAIEAARVMAQPIRDLVERCEEYGDELDIDELKKLVYAEWELRG